MITEGLLGRHYAGRAGGRDPALLDIAQDHALVLLHGEGIFDMGVVLKGGTALRKLRAGNQGRFSTDLDFAGAGPDEAELLLTVLDGAEIAGFRFSVERVNEHRRSNLHVESNLGASGIPARIDCSPKPAWLDPEVLVPVALPIHEAYDVILPGIPTMTVEEVIGEKLARYRRISLARDLYDLAWFARGGPLDEALIRRIAVLKVWFDVVDDGLGVRPFDVGHVLDDRDARSFNEESIGLLTTPVDLPGWISQVQRRFAFLRNLQPDEARIVQCNPGDRFFVNGLVESL